MRAMVRMVLARVAKTGLPGEHHFYIAFDTQAPGVSLSKRLTREVSQGDDRWCCSTASGTWASSDDRFEVKLTFDGIPERLSVPFAAIKVFFDPSVPYGLQFEDFDLAGAAAQELVGPQRESGSPKSAPAVGGNGAHDAPAGRTDKKPRAARRAQPEKAAERAPAAGTDKASGKPMPTLVKPAEPSPAKGPKVVSIDAFRNKK